MRRRARSFRRRRHPRVSDGAGPLSVVLSTFESEEQAREVARQLLKERLIACGTVLSGLTSIYRWRGEIEVAGEVMLLMKTRAELVSALRARIGELHPYEVPEVLALSVDEVADAYGRWVWQETTEVNE